MALTWVMRPGVNVNPLQLTAMTPAFVVRIPSRQAAELSSQPLAASLRGCRFNFRPVRTVMNAGCQNAAEGN